ncbi:unnamed protein product [Diatraea saccharalis]|uniref:Uncharacterized protein n=1 Tax=Diatraea saccharalis TaxID=40085 RepID=A0A9N9N0W0_9NEOP|nr:unnamed protein product [Diatraea saccharalis]
MWAGGPAHPPSSSRTQVERLELTPRRSSTQQPYARTAYSVLPTRNSRQEASSQYLDSSYFFTNCILSWTPTFGHTFLRHHLSVQMPLEPRSTSREYRRMYRRYQNPSRPQSLSERMHRYRPNLASLQEEESMEQRSNTETQERPRLVAKRRAQHRTAYSNPIINGHDHQLQIIASNERTRYPSSFTQWQADEPQIIITSDVQMQTDDSEPMYELTLTVNSSVQSAATLSSSGPQATHGAWTTIGRRVCSSSAIENTNGTLDIFREPVDRAISGYQSIHNGYPTSNVTDRATQISPEPYENTEHPVHGNPGIINSFRENSNTVNLNSENSEVINLDTELSPVDQIPENPGTIDVTSKNQEPKCCSSKSVDVNLLSAPTYVSYQYARSSILYLPAPTLESRQVANRVIKHARNNKTLDEKALHCLNCDFFPVLPVTGQCGHTRCTKCIQSNGPCPCGAEAPKSLHVNTVIQYLMRKMLPEDVSRRETFPGPRVTSNEPTEAAASQTTDAMCSKPKKSRRRDHSRSGRSGLVSLRIRATYPNINERMPMSPQIQFEYARQMLSLGRYRDAAPHFARVAVSSGPLAYTARTLLAQIIVVLAEGRDPRRITRDLFRSVRLQSAASWIRPNDLECVLCYQTYIKPVTTPCGHTYCRTCIERALDYRKSCALCLRSLDDFDLSTTHETTFVKAALDAIDASKPPLPLDPDVIPIFVCTVAYPSIPCPLFIFDPRYWLMIRRVLESGSRKFGMVAYERNKNYSDYGTVLEVCDCVHLEDGRSFLSTVGVSRFRVIERDVRDGCDVARIQPLTDITPTDEFVMLEMRLMGSQILCKALMWLNSMNETVRQEIENSFGQIPRTEHVQENWCYSPDGPAWLWWLIAILPLRSEIKILILSTKNLLKRMMAVSRTLDAIDQVAITTTATSECEIRSALTNADEWLERGS